MQSAVLCIFVHICSSRCMHIFRVSCCQQSTSGFLRLSQHLNCEPLSNPTRFHAHYISGALKCFSAPPRPKGAMVNATLEPGGLTGFVGNCLVRLVKLYALGGSMYPNVENLAQTIAVIPRIGTCSCHCTSTRTPMQTAF